MNPTIPKPKPGGLDPDSIIDAFAHRMMYSVARDEFNATEENTYQALAYATRDRLMDRWFATQDAYYRQDVKRVYYLSLEFLLGRLLKNNIISLCAEQQFAQAMHRLGFDIGHSETPITPVILGDSELTIRFSNRLFDEGVFGTSVVFPTVALDRARIRTIVTAAHTDDLLDRALTAFDTVGHELGVISG